MKSTFVPDAGDFVWLTFDPQAGPRAGRTPSGSGPESESVQRKIRPGAGMPNHESG